MLFSPFFEPICSQLHTFNDFCNTYISMAHQVFVRYSREIRAAEMLAQENATSYLDLAFPNPSKCTNWKRCVRNRVIFYLPVAIREFFLAETIDPYQKLTGVINEVMIFNRNRIVELEYHLREMDGFLLCYYEDLIFNPIENQYDFQKKWNVSRYLRAYKAFGIDRFAYVFPFLMALCTDPPLDSGLTIDILTTMCDTDEKQMEVFAYPPNERSLINLIHHARETRFDFWGMWSGIGCVATCFDFIHYFLVSQGRQEYPWILLKYGFPYLGNFGEHNCRSFFLERLEFNGVPIIQTVAPLFDEADANNKTKRMLIIDTFMIFGNFDNSADIGNRVRTLVYLTRAIPDPYLTPFELYGTMLKVVVQQFEPYLCALVHNYYTAGIFEHNYFEPAPRRLVHLCRVAVRKRLAENFQLLDGIQELNIPAELKTYLELES